MTEQQETEQQDQEPQAKISKVEFLKKRKETRPSHVFDLRSADEYGIGHLVGAHNLPFEIMSSNLHRLPFSGEMLFYDGGEGLTGQAADILHENGFSDYYYVEEGLDALNEELEGSEYEIRLSCVGSDSREVKMEAIQNLLEFEINPMVASHGGFFTLLGVEGNDVTVELGGGCQGCGMVDVTLREGVEKRMREVFPDMGALIDNTDHEGGDDPYYQSGK